jgi:hypothetical protein
MNRQTHGKWSWMYTCGGHRLADIRPVAMFGYKLKKFDLIFGYRYLDWNFDDKASLEDLTFHGPSAGVRFVF